LVELMIIPFCAAVLLTVIFVYFGIHIIQRQVIFVDLALAQIAALGAMMGLMFGTHLHSTGSYLFSLLFALAGAMIFALTRLKGRLVPQEAVIGIVYVAATAASIILLNSSPSEAEHIKHMLVGNILFVRWHDVLRLAVICGVIGLFHFLFRKRFFKMSADPEKTGESGRTVRWWDFLFYASLGVVVTSAVEVAGVLLIFSYLVVPAACAMLMSANLRHQLIIGWTLGIMTSLTGLLLSGILDLPTGAAIVCAFGVVFIAVLLGSPGVYHAVKRLWRKKSIER
jgi:zinc/manganese transport system permease protein